MDGWLEVAFWFVFDRPALFWGELVEGKREEEGVVR